jgi:hypothetical protein
MAGKIKPDHDQLVQTVAKHLKQRFYRDIRAKVAGFRYPEGVPSHSDGSGHMPDVTMIAKDEQLNILDVETANSLSDGGRGERWAALARHAGQQKGKFWLVVPKGLRPTAEARLEDLDLDANVWELEL